MSDEEIYESGDSAEVFTTSSGLFIQIGNEKIPVENGDGITLTLVKTLARDRGIGSFVIKDAETNDYLHGDDFPRRTSVRIEEVNKAA